MTDGPHVSAWFWDLLESSGRSLRSLCRKLEGLPKEELRRYRLEYDEAKSQVDPCSWDACQPFLSRGCSEDHGDDFAAWVVMQGREFFGRVRSHPQDVQRHLEMFGEVEMRRGPADLRWDNEVDREEYRGCQRADYIASPIYRARFGEDLCEACYDERGWPREEP
jgi:uncharacterized protein DUF4240